MRSELTILEQICRVSKSVPGPAVEDWRKRGGKVVGYFCSYVPEGILLAAGVLPYRICPTGCLQTTDADAYFSHVNCTFVRSCLQFGLEGKYSFLDGLVFVNTCDHTRRLYDLWREKVDPLPLFVHPLDISHKTIRATMLAASEQSRPHDWIGLSLGSEQDLSVQ